MNENFKRKTAMVLHQIEESLGSFVLNNGNLEALNVDSLENIHKRELDKGRGFNSGSIKDIVEATYLDELFGFALDIAKDSSIIDSIKYLYSLFHHLDVYEIRNAISHPNRPFWDCYWYRVAALASDPVNDRLGLEDVKKVLVSATNNTIVDPPEEWVNKVIWQIPNNLPKQFDHGLTGLIGRTKELNELKKYVANPRVNTMALVAPGGSGKTALALDLLNSIITAPSYSKFLDVVLYATMKTERLTAEGVVSLDSVETISELKRSIVESLNFIFDENNIGFEDAIENHKDDKVLLCLDNLETLLRDDPNSFDELNFCLPPTWQVLVTSRVSISNATILSLKSLTEKSALHLARTYYLKRGGQTLSENEYVELIKGCFCNPLAIRLTLDLVLVGKPIPASLNVANKEIAEFSYNNLIDALSENAIKILEAVFVEDSSTRLSLCGLLEMTLDDVSDGIGELTRTSLISRISNEQGESYRLSDSVRDLLVISPKNIKIRSKVQATISKRRVLSKAIDIKQNEKDLPTWHVDFIPKSTDEQLKILITEVNNSIKKAKRNTDIAIALFKKLRDSKFMFEQSPIYHRSLARVLEVLKDFNSAETHYKQAISLQENEPLSIFLLAKLYSYTKRFSLAHQTFEKLIEAGWVEDIPDNEVFGRQIYQGYFLALLNEGKYDIVFEVTKEWKKSITFRGHLGTFRAAAWKRKMEHIVESEPAVAVDALVRASKIMGDVFGQDGYFKTANIQAKKIFEEIEFCFSRPDYYKNFSLQGN